MVEGPRPAVFQLVLLGVHSAEQVERGEGEQVDQQADHRVLEVFFSLPRLGCPQSRLLLPKHRHIP